MTGLETIVIEGFLGALGAIVVAFVIAEVARIFSDRQNSEAFRAAMIQMSQNTVVAVESIKETTITAVNSIANMSALNDVNSLASKKVDHNQQNK